MKRSPQRDIRYALAVAVLCGLAVPPGAAPEGAAESVKVTLTPLSGGQQVSLLAPKKSQTQRTFEASPVYYYNGRQRVDLFLALDELAVEDPEVAGRSIEADLSGDLSHLGVAATVEPGCCEKPQAYLRFPQAATMADLEANAVQLASLMAERQVRPMLYASEAEKRAPERSRQLSDTFSIKLADPAALNDLARRHGFEVIEEVHYSPNTWIVRMAGASLLGSLETANRIYETEPGIEWATPLFLRLQEKRFTPNDTFYPQQWHLNNTGANSGTGGVAGEDINVVPAWNMMPDVTGLGQTIAIVDDGMEYTHEDLAANSRTDIDWDFCGNDNDPAPGAGDNHGTACAGTAAAVGGNGIGVTGAAPEAELVGVRLIACANTDSMEGQAMAWQVNPGNPNDRVHINSNSWGPFDDATRLEAPGPLALAGIVDGITNGRGGLGTIYVWAAGNGRQNTDNVNYDGYASSRYTVAVGATGRNGIVSYYSEEGASMLVNAPSNDSVIGITTVDRSGTAGYNGMANNNYTNGFGGTSSACPLAAGVIALILEANPNLTWRDLQHVLVQTAEQNHAADPGWFTNGAGLTFNHAYGFGRIDAAAAVTAAQGWTNVPASATPLTGNATVSQIIPDGNATGITNAINIAAPPNFVTEHVEVTVNITHTYRGDVQLTLTSPDGTESFLTREHNDSNDNFNNWMMTTVANWGEDPTGNWTLRAVDNITPDQGTWNNWSITVHGYVSTPPLNGETTVAPGPGSEPATISSLQTVGWDAPMAMDFTVTDDGSNPGEDALPTRFNEVVVKPGPGNDLPWVGNIAGAELRYNGMSWPASSVTNSAITFDGIPNSMGGSFGHVADNASNTYALHVWLEEGLADGNTADGQNFEFRVDGYSFTVEAMGSSEFTDSNMADSGASNNQVAVVATELRFAQQPPASAIVNSDFAASVHATDRHGNRDVNQGGNVTLTTPCADGNLSAASGLAKALSGGLASWTDLRVDAASPCRLLGTHGTLGAVESDTFLVNPVTVVVIETWTNASLNGTGNPINGVNGNGSITRGSGLVRVNTANQHNSRAWAGAAPSLADDDYVFIIVDTTGYQNIQVDYTTGRDGNGPTNVQLWHGTFPTVGQTTAPPSYTLPNTNPAVFNLDLTSLTELNNNAQATLVWDGYSAGNTNNGQMYLHTLSVSGTPIGGGATGPGRLEFAEANFETVETDGTATVTVRRVGGTTGAVSVQYATSHGTAMGGDYTPASGTLNFANGVDEQSFAVTITDDNDPEPNETINLELTNPGGGATLGCRDTATLTILGEDQDLMVPSGNPPRLYATRGARGWVDFSNVSAGGNFNVILTRTSAGVSNIGGMADVRWSVFPDAGVTWSGPVRVTFEYRDAEIAMIMSEPNLRIYKGPGPGGPWTECITDIDPVNNIITAEITSFSDIVLADDNVLAVELDYFTATGTVGGQVNLEWRTTEEIGSAGFHVYRGVDDDGRAIMLGERLTDSVIPALGGGTTYQHTDTVPTSPDETRLYFLQELELGGATSLHGPFEAILQSAPTTVNDWTVF